MKKALLAALAIFMVMTMVACGAAESENDQDTSSSEITESQDEQSTEETSGTTEEDAGQSWPSVIPADVPVLSDVTIEGYWPMETGASEYTVNFAVAEENKSVITDYVAALTTAGYTQKSVSENNFGVDYVYNNDKYQIFMNVIYGGASKIAITIK